MTALTLVDETEVPAGKVDVELIDCDVHLAPRELDEIVAYMAEPWRSKAGRRINGGKPTYTPFGDAMRADSHPVTGLAGSDPDLVAQQVFREAGTDFALILPLVGGFSVDPELNAAFAAAINDWLAATWLGRYNAERRFYGSITVSTDDPVAAACEIERLAGEPAFRQVLISHHGEHPFGHPAYEPIWAAAARHELPVAVHFRRVAAESFGLTPTGHFQHFVDFHALAYPLTYAAHLVSWLCSGVFDRHPNLRVVFVEGGFLWYRPLIERLAYHWALTSSELPVHGAKPLDSVRGHVRWTTQPIEERDDGRALAAAFERADADRVLLFSSDYPHYDYDLPSRALPAQLRKETKERVFWGNARELYRLPAVRARDRFDGSVTA